MQVCSFDVSFLFLLLFLSRLHCIMLLTNIYNYILHLRRKQQGRRLITNWIKLNWNDITKIRPEDFASRGWGDAGTRGATGGPACNLYGFDLGSDVHLGSCERGCNGSSRQVLYCNPSGAARSLRFVCTIRLNQQSAEFTRLRHLEKARFRLYLGGLMLSFMLTWFWSDVLKKNKKKKTWYIHMCTLL